MGEAACPSETSKNVLCRVRTAKRARLRPPGFQRPESICCAGGSQNPDSPEGQAEGGETARLLETIKLVLCRWEPESRQPRGPG
jgi:hypothetical protein